MSISREQVERVTNRMYNDAKKSGRDVSRETVRDEVVKRAQKQNTKKSK
jgi:hypothetical protein